MNFFKRLSIYIMGSFYIWIGIKHFVEPVDPFLHIIPPFLKPIGLELVYISGFFEVIFGFMLFDPLFRKWGSYGLIALLIAVYPANLYLAFYEAPQIATGYDPFIVSWVRLPIQFVFIGLAYWHSRD